MEFSARHDLRNYLLCPSYFLMWLLNIGIKFPYADGSKNWGAFVRRSKRDSHCLLRNMISSELKRSVICKKLFLYSLG